MTTVSICLERTPLPHHLPLILAQGVGLFEARDLDVELITPDTPFETTAPPDNTDLSLVLTSPLHLVNRHLLGEDFMGIARLYENEACLLVGNHLECDQPADLTGPLTVASQGLPRDLTRTILRWIVESKEGSLDDEEIDVQSPADPLAAFEEGNVDLLFPAWLVPDVVETRTLEADAWYFPNIGLPDGGELVLAGYEDNVNALPNETQSLLGALHTAGQRILEDPDQARQILNLHAGAEELEYSDELIESSFEGFTDDLGQNSDCYREWGEFLDEHGNYEGFIDLDRIMDERFIPFDAMDLSF